MHVRILSWNPGKDSSAESYESMPNDGSANELPAECAGDKQGSKYLCISTPAFTNKHLDSPQHDINPISPTPTLYYELNTFLARLEELYGPAWQATLNPLP